MATGRRLDVVRRSRPSLATQRDRLCLRHGGMFLSDGPGNRICNDCKRTKRRARMAQANLIDDLDLVSQTHAPLYLFDPPYLRLS